MVGASAWVWVHALADIVLEFQKIAEQAAWNVDELASDDDYLLSSEELLGDDWSEASEQMATSVDDHLFVEHFSPFNK